MGIVVTKIGSYNAIEYTPDSVSGKLPVFIEIPGAGECGTDPTLLYKYGGLNFVKNSGWKPNFMIIGAQPVNSWPPAATEAPIFMRTILDAVVKMPNVDTTKIYLTGYSNGSATVMHYMQYELDAYYHPIAAVIPMSMNMFALGGNYYANPKTDFLTGNDLRFLKTAVWALCGNYDDFRETETHFVDLVNKKGGTAIYSEWPYGSPTQKHGGWNTPYDPNYKNPTSIWDWALQYSTVAAPVVIPPPVVPPPPVKTVKSVVVITTFSDGSTQNTTVV